MKNRGILLKDRLLLIRPHQWAKSLFVFAPSFFAFRLFDMSVMARSAIAALAFSLVSSGVYVFNDILDRETDSLHPFKKDRAIASGKVSICEGSALSSGFIAAGLSIVWFLGHSSFWILILYLGLNVFYSINLKNIPVVDVVCIAIGFLLRVVIGGTATGIPLSPWILAMTFLLAMFLAMAKRRDDLLTALSWNRAGRKSLNGYNLLFMNTAIVLCAGILLATYLMYSLDADVIAKMGSRHLFYTFLFVLMGVLRYLQLIFVKNDSGEPTRHFFRDPVLRFVMLGWAGLFMSLLYGAELFY